MKMVKVKKMVALKDASGRVRMTKSVILNGFVDDLSGETFIPAAELKKVDELKVVLSGVMLPEEIKALRNRYNKTQEDMCAIFGLGNRTWTRWESGAVVPNVSMCRTLFLLRDGKLTLEDLCHQQLKCVDWFGKSTMRCVHCSGLAHQFAAMKNYDKVVKGKGVGHAPTEIEVAA